MSDFKTNEYANLIGGKAYEPVEENPMIGFRGASRYYNPRYQAGFALECQAMKKVRDEMGLSNVKLMIPFCRTVEEGKTESVPDPAPPQKPVGTAGGNAAFGISTATAVLIGVAAAVAGTVIGVVATRTPASPAHP